MYRRCRLPKKLANARLLTNKSLVSRRMHGYPWHGSLTAREAVGLRRNARNGEEVQKEKEISNGFPLWSQTLPWAYDNVTDISHFTSPTWYAVGPGNVDPPNVTLKSETERRRRIFPRVFIGVRLKRFICRQLFQALKGESNFLLSLKTFIVFKNHVLYFAL